MLHEEEAFRTQPIEGLNVRRGSGNIFSEPAQRLCRGSRRLHQPVGTQADGLPDALGLRH
jgi:hypothetical protein